MADEYLTVDCPMVLCDATAGEMCRPTDSGKPHCMRWVAVTSPQKARAFCEQQARDQLAAYRNDEPVLRAMAADSEHPLARYATRTLSLIPRLAAALATVDAGGQVAAGGEPEGDALAAGGEPEVTPRG